jgi:KaiC/GvpD/RAD55 family RecA-like ATPase
MDNEIKKSPTGVPSLDPIIKGGLPNGSFILILGEVGAGSQEFIYTSMLGLSQLVKAPPKLDGTVLPKKICYISFTKTKENIVQDVATLHTADIKDVEDNLVFIDLSEQYFSRSHVPPSWTSYSGDIFKPGQRKARSLFSLFTDTLDKHAANNLVIIDSLNDLVRSSYSDNFTWNDLVSLLKGIERMAKQWNCVIYALMTADIFEKSKQEEVSDCVDGVLVFAWDATGVNQRQRTMYIKKFRGLMPYLEDDNVVKFETSVTAKHGFEISNIREIMGK